MTDKFFGKFRKDHTDQPDQPLNPGEGTTIQQHIETMSDGTVIGQQINYYPAEPTYISTASGLLIDDPDDVPNLPPKLVGREDLLAQTRTALETNASVLLLQGFGGVGKTALAAWIAQGYLQSGKFPVLWLEAGNAEAGALLEGLSRPFGVDQARAVASLPLDGGQHHVRGLLKAAGVQLVVLDNAWDGNALNAALAAIPKGIPALVTSRQKMPTGALIEVGVLSRPAALELLRLHAKQDGPGADELCDLLGDHAYALEIAGKTIQVDGLTPAELTRRIKDAPHTLRMPEDFAETGRESIASLIEVSLTALRAQDETAYRAFLAFGAFFAPSLTAELLEIFFTPPPKSPSPPDKEGDLTGDAVQTDVGTHSGTPVSEGEVTTALTLLARRGLADHLPATENTIASYRVHDLSHSYARAQQDATAHERALAACLTYTKKYKQPSLANFAALRPALDTLMGAAGWALENGHYKETEDFAWGLNGAADGFLSLQGYPRQAITLLGMATTAARKRGDQQAEGAHRDNLGAANADLGQVERAIEYHGQALKIARETGNKRSEGVALGSMGNAYYLLGQIERAIGFYEQALVISREISDKRSEGAWLGNLGMAYVALEQIERAIGFYEQALVISHKIRDRRGEGHRLCSLGIAYTALGQVERAIGFYEQALAIGREIGHKRGEGDCLGNLGIAYKKLGQIERAIDLYEQALAIKREIGDRKGEAHELNNLGVAYVSQGNYPRALDFYEHARAIFIAIGAAHLVAQVDRNIARVREKMGG